MADPTSEAELKVGVSGEEKIAGLKTGLAGLEQQAKKTNQQAGQAAASVAGTATLTTGFTQTLERVGERVGYTLGRSIRAPYDAARAATRMAGTSIMAFTGPLGVIASEAGGAAVVVGGIAAILTGMGPTIVTLTAGFVLMGKSIEWAKEQAEEQLRIAARTRRFFPHLLGDALEDAEGEMEIRMGVVGALFGKSAESMQEQITKRITDFRLGKGMRGEKEIFAQFQLTPESIREFEQKTGQRMDLTKWMEVIVRKREELEKQMAAAPEGSEAFKEAAAWRVKLFDFSIKVFGQKFADMAGVMTSRDMTKLAEGIRKATELGNVKDATRKSAEFWVSLNVMTKAFEKISLGIGGDLQPAITEFLNTLNKKLTDEGLGKALREMGTEAASYAIETLSNLIRDINVPKIEAWTTEINKWKPEETAADIQKLIDGAIWLGKTLLGIKETTMVLIRAMAGLGEEEKKVEALKPGGANAAPATPVPVPQGASPAGPRPVPLPQGTSTTPRPVPIPQTGQPQREGSRAPGEPIIPRPQEPTQGGATRPRPVQPAPGSPGGGPLSVVPGSEQTATGVQELQGGARRNLRIADDLRSQLAAAAAETGVVARVTSGGQLHPFRLPSGKMTSHRHDVTGTGPGAGGGAADVQLVDAKTGRLLDDRIPEDRARMVAFTRATVKYGATGVGAGPGYMGPSTIHIGGGSATTWGGAAWVTDAWRLGMQDRQQQANPVPPPVLTETPTVNPSTGKAAADGQAFGESAVEVMRQQLIESLQNYRDPATSQGVAPRSAPKPTGGDTASDS